MNTTLQTGYDNSFLNIMNYHRFLVIHIRWVVLYR